MPKRVPKFEASGKKTLGQSLREHLGEQKPSERDARVTEIILNRLEHVMQNPFPIRVFPKAIQTYLRAWSASLCCSHDLLAVPLLSVAGAAIGRAGRRLQVLENWTASSCLWAVCIAGSSEGKSPALNAVQNFYLDEEGRRLQKWQEVKEAHDENPKDNPKPGPRPTMYLTDTTLESLRCDLASGPVLYANDELGAWCQQMGQYKGGGGGGADKSSWLSFWSHGVVSIGRKSGDRLRIDNPFVAVTGMMVPGSAHYLNYQGHEDDGFVHRMLIACPPPSPMIYTGVGVPGDLTTAFKRCMTRLFESPGGNPTLHIAPAARREAEAWINRVHYGNVHGAADWIRARYKKLTDNLWRVALVLHELRRVAETDEERAATNEAMACAGLFQKVPYVLDGVVYEVDKVPPFDPTVVDLTTMIRAIDVIDYFKDQIPAVQTHLDSFRPVGGVKRDKVEELYKRLRHEGKVDVRTLMRRSSSCKTADDVRGVFAVWEERGYGAVETGDRSDQLVFRFNETDCQ